MTQPCSEMRQTSPYVSEIVVDVLSRAVIVLAGIIAVAQFAYY